MAYESINLAVRDGLARLTLNQPERGNPVDDLFCREWLAAVNELAGRDDIRAVLITAEGRFFSVGGDIKTFIKERDDLPAVIRRLTVQLHAGISRLVRLDAPIIAAVQGTCGGGGCSLVANCDLVYAGRSARLGANYTQIGFSCDAGATAGLTARMGVSRARRFLLLAEMLEAEQAERAGLVDVVVDDDALQAEAEKAAIQISQGPTRAFGEICRLINTASRQPLEAQLEDEAQGLARIAGSEDAGEGIAAFMEKRQPRFSGR